MENFDPDHVNRLVLLHLRQEGIDGNVLSRLENCLTSSEPKRKRHKCEIASAEASDLFKACQFAFDSMFTLTVVCLNGSSQRLQVQACTTVKEVKLMLEANTSIPWLSQKLVCENVELHENSSPLIKYHIGPFKPTLTLLRMPCLFVAGCGDEEVANKICGSYYAKEERKGRIKYVKHEKVDGHTVYLYYWDDRTGDHARGWWFGFKPTSRRGMNSAWAFNPSICRKPPESGWRQPWNGDVDPSIRISDSSFMR
eukprot:TRINITY_DN47533_c0_g1_i1.p1 TRINITY_DN47533_c0_g1~~TRINITY_DN47533_c0_g1_i1.p1  ORF type:complete len:268 (-),score=36.72 TRINITY_DN47533_c0_g1_i1:17-778(-)